MSHGRGTVTHHFSDTGTCYDATQSRDDIAFNDLLVVESEQVVGVLYSAWPTAVTAAHGELHSFRPRSQQQPGDGPASGEVAAITAAIALASKYGWELDAAAVEMAKGSSGGG